MARIKDRSKDSCQGSSKMEKSGTFQNKYGYLYPAAYGDAYGAA